MASIGTSGDSSRPWRGTGLTGEVMLPIRGGTEAFVAYPISPGDSLAVGYLAVHFLPQHRWLSDSLTSAPSPAAVSMPAPVPAPAIAGATKPRFGIGSLINRMAGHLEVAPPAAAGRAQPPVTSYDDEHEIDNDQDRIEIPAFLRRQAN